MPVATGKERALAAEVFRVRIKLAVLLTAHRARGVLWLRTRHTAVMARRGNAIAGLGLSVFGADAPIVIAELLFADQAVLHHGLGQVVFTACGSRDVRAESWRIRS